MVCELKGWEPNSARRVAVEELARDLLLHDLLKGAPAAEAEVDTWDSWDPDADEPPATSWPPWRL